MEGCLVSEWWMGVERGGEEVLGVTEMSVRW